MFRLLRGCSRIATLPRRYLQTSSVVARASDAPQFPGARGQFVQNFNFVIPENLPGIDVYRLMDRDGNILNESELPALDKEECLKIYHTMVQLSVMDKLLYESQRQGRISFYMTNYGEEGVHTGVASALDPGDWIWGQYREAGVIMYRGFTLDQFMNQCYSNCLDIGQGKQMPVHYGCRELNFVTISSTLATQICQAAGNAYAFKREQNGKIVVCFFGDGAASEGDFHAGLNFAATLDCPIVFVCRNNGYAISTPTSEQYKGDGIASRGVGYGVSTIRVDGNDVFAVHKAMAEARKHCLEEMRPVLLEAMTYRVGHHSTSDDSTAYRSTDEVSFWQKHDSPIGRMFQYLSNKGWWSEDEDKAQIKRIKSEVMKAFQAAEKQLKPDPALLFSEVFKDLTPKLQQQYKEMVDHVERHKEHYPLSQYQPMTKPT